MWSLSIHKFSKYIVRINKFYYVQNKTNHVSIIQGGNKMISHSERYQREQVFKTTKVKFDNITYIY